MTTNPWDPAEWSVEPSELAERTLPFISLGVLNYNRCDALRQTLDVLVNAVQYPHYEIIVIDNGSTDGSAEMVQEFYPQVVLHALGENKGVSSRNRQTTQAKGKYLFSFDDDTYPASPSMIYRMVRYLEKNNDVAGLCGRVEQPVTGHSEMQGWHAYYDGDPKGVQCFSPPEGAVCFRLEALRKTEGYETRFLYGAEGRELAIQFHALALKIYYNPQFAILHFPPPKRTIHVRASLEWRHTLWMFAKHWPLYWLPLLVLVWVLRRILGLVTHPELVGVTMKSLAEGLAGMPEFVQHRPKLTLLQSLGLWRYYRQIFRW